MLNIGQLAKFEDTGERFIYAGAMLRLNATPELPNGYYGIPIGGARELFPLDHVNRPWSHIEDSKGQPVMGTFADYAGLRGQYFGLLWPENLDDDDWAAVDGCIEGGVNV